MNVVWRDTRFRSTKGDPLWLYHFIAWLYDKSTAAGSWYVEQIYDGLLNVLPICVRTVVQSSRLFNVFVLSYLFIYVRSTSKIDWYCELTT